MGFKRTIIVGASWLGAFRGASRVVSFFKTIFLARILSPSQFGIFGVAQLVLVFLDIITDTGISAILVQEKEYSKKTLDTAWIISIIRGFILGVVILIAAPFVSSFFKSPSAQSVLILISLVPIIKGFANPSVVEFQKKLFFHKEFWYRTIIFSVDATCAVIFTFLTKNPSGIVYGLIAGAITEVFLSYIMTSDRPSFAYSSSVAWQLFHRGKWLTGSSIFSYILANGDNISVGRILNTTSLGIYQMAYAVSILPISEVTDVLSKVTFPVYVQLEDNVKRLRQVYVKIFILTVIFSFPLSLILYFFPSQIITVVLGNKWAATASVLPTLAIASFIRSISNTTFPVFLAVKKQQQITIIQAIASLVLIVTIVPLIYTYGLLGASYSVLLATLASAPIAFFFLFKNFNE